MTLSRGDIYENTKNSDHRRQQIKSKIDSHHIVDQ
jgi:hypothetical protein